jgi:hypothetical protein
VRNSGSAEALDMLQAMNTGRAAPWAAIASRCDGTHAHATRGQGRRRLWVPLAAAVMIGLAAFVLVWFEPHKLFIDERVD